MGSSRASGGSTRPEKVGNDCEALANVYLSVDMTDGTWGRVRVVTRSARQMPSDSVRVQVKLFPNLSSLPQPPLKPKDLPLWWLLRLASLM